MSSTQDPMTHTTDTHTGDSKSMTSNEQTITSTRAACGATITTGTRVFDFYDGHWGTVGDFDQWNGDGWFDHHRDNGTRGYLNGERVAVVLPRGNPYYPEWEAGRELAPAPELDADDAHLARMDAAHGAPDYDDELPTRKQDCSACGGPAPTCPEDSSHDDCGPLSFTDSAWRRSHMKQPRGTGSWLFQRTTAETAYGDECWGDQVALQGTLSEAKMKLRALGHRGLWAVLP